MAPQVRFLFKLFILVCTGVACTSVPSIEKGTSFYNKDSSQLLTQGGVTYLNHQPISGVVYELFPNGIDTLKITSYSKGYKHGRTQVFYPRHILREDRKYDMGSKEGLYTGYFPDGSIQFTYPFVNDYYQGTLKEWNPKGLLIRELNYDLGHEQGSQKVWYDNGKIKSNYVIKNGRRYGLLGTKNCTNVKDSIPF